MFECMQYIESEHYLSFDYRFRSTYTGNNVKINDLVHRIHFIYTVNERIIESVKCTITLTNYISLSQPLVHSLSVAVSVSVLLVLHLSISSHSLCTYFGRYKRHSKPLDERTVFGRLSHYGSALALHNIYVN